MEVLLFEPLTTSLGEPGQPFAWAAAGLDDQRSLGVGHWSVSPRPQDGWSVNPRSIAIQGYLEAELVVRDCLRDAARDFCRWLSKRFTHEHLLIATSVPALCRGETNVLAQILVHDAERWWRPHPDVLDTRSLATRAGTPEPPWVGDAQPGKLDLAQRRLARGLQALRALPPSAWASFDPRTATPLETESCPARPSITNPR